MKKRKLLTHYQPEGKVYLLPSPEGDYEATDAEVQWECGWRGCEERGSYPNYLIYAETYCFGDLTTHYKQTHYLLDRANRAR